MIDRVGRTEDLAELLGGGIDDAKLVAKLSGIVGIAENELLHFKRVEHFA